MIRSVVLVRISAAEREPAAARMYLAGKADIKIRGIKTLDGFYATFPLGDGEPKLFLIATYGGNRS